MSTDRAKDQRRIDAVEWYHDFDFPDGLAARTTATDAAAHRKMWRFIEGELAHVDFAGKSVLDVGCWDGYWSFYAEKRGARSVLASDDATQNWAGSQGLLLARELLGSRVETRLDQSVYDVASLGRTFDVVLFLGVYYHLHDPFHALAQLRHCCHPETVVVVEGNVVADLPPCAAIADMRTPFSKYTPTPEALRHLLQATYFQVQSEAATPLDPPADEVPAVGWRWRLATCWRALCGSREGVLSQARAALGGAGAMRRVLWVCRPFAGENDIHAYPPPLGLRAYDSRWGRAALSA